MHRVFAALGVVGAVVAALERRPAWLGIDMASVLVIAACALYEYSVAYREHQFVLLPSGPRA